MKFTQALLFAFMAYQANAGLFGGDKTDITTTSNTDVNQTAGDSGAVNGTQGNQTAGDGPVSGDTNGGQSGPTTATSGGLHGGTTQIEADHTITGGSSGDVSNVANGAPCTGSCNINIAQTGQSTSGPTTDSSSATYSDVGSVNGTTGNVEGGDSIGGSGGNSTATGPGGSNTQTQTQTGAPGGDIQGPIRTGDQSPTNNHDEETDLDFSPTVALPPLRRYMPGAYGERSADVLV